MSDIYISDISEFLIPGFLYMVIIPYFKRNINNGAMTKTKLLFSFLILPWVIGCSQTTIPDREIQIASAVMATSEEERSEATVFGYNSHGDLVLLREGSNNTICLSDEPKREGFQGVC